MSQQSAQESPHVKIGPLIWKHGHQRADYSKPFTAWIFGKRFVGKSSLGEAIITNFMRYGATAFDIFSARDNESLAWLRSPYKNSVLLLCGNTINLKCDYPWIHLKDFNLEDAEKFKLVVTSPRFYSTEGEQFSALSFLVDKLKWRTEWKKVDVLFVREAARFLASRQYAGKVKNKMEAEHEMIDLLQESYHTGVAVVVDSLRPNSIDINIREIANFVFIKRMGRLAIPREFYYLMRYVDPTHIRTMDVDKFVLYTDEDNIAIGKYDEVPWHVKRGENILKSLKIEIEQNEDQPLVEEGQQDGISSSTHQLLDRQEWKGNRLKLTKEVHLAMVGLREQGKTYADIIKALPVKVSPMTVSNELRAHQSGTCKWCNQP